MTRIEELFAAACALQPADRAAYLDVTCAGDPALRRRVQELLDGLDLSQRAFPEPIIGRPPPAPDEHPGERIGRYKLLQKLGEGGCGVVWMAEQEVPVRRRVALKVLKLGMDTRSVIARFEAERQALAMMEHPNIARVLDAGATATGRPYFVMELVRGIPITRFCDEENLSTDQRLELFVQVCHAIQHAHQKGIIHRDIKPSNILVTRHDDRAVPMIIDFGIAKATQGRLTDQTLFTAFEQFMGTPAYMSPEQSQLNALDIDTRSDIYSLGVLLYELLTGRTPFDSRELVQAGLDEIRRRIREVDPPRPSTRLSTLEGATLAEIARHRRIEPPRLIHLVRGDLDWIVMRCLEKDRTRRYDTASALAHDIERHFHHEPISARPRSTFYRARKFVQRHRIGVAASVALIVSLAGGLGLASVAFVSERAAHRRAVAAEQVQAVLRAKADAARTAAAVQSSRMSIARAEQLSNSGDGCAALAYLVHAARSDPTNAALGPRLLSELAYRDYFVAEGPALTHPDRVLQVLPIAANRVATVASDNVLRIWDPNRPAVLFSYQIGEARWVSVSRDHAWLALLRSDGTTDVVDINTGRRLLRVDTGAAYPVREGLLFSRDSRWLITPGPERNMLVWDAVSGDQRAVLAHDASIESATLSPDGQFLCTVTTGHWRLWRIPTGELLAAVPGETSSPLTLAAFSPNGEVLAVLDYDGAQFWDPRARQKVGARMRHRVEHRPASFSPDGTTFATGAADGTVCFWAVPSGAPLGEPLRHAVPVFGGVHFDSKEPLVVTIAANDRLYVWDLRDRQLATPVLRASDFVPGPEGCGLFVIPSHHVIRRMRLTRGIHALAFRGSEMKGLVGFHFRPGDRMACAVFADRLQCFDWPTGQLIGEPRELPVSIQHFRMSANSAFLAVGIGRATPASTAAADTDAELWDLRRAGVVRRRLKARFGEDVHFSSNSGYVGISDRTQQLLRVWNTESGALVVGPVANAFMYFAFSPDERQIAVTRGSSVARLGTFVSVYDLSTGRLTREIPTVTDVTAFSPDARLLATCPGGTALWRLDDRAAGPTWIPTGPRTRSAQFASDGRHILVSRPHGARIWDIETLRPLTTEMTIEGVLRTAIFSGDESRVAGVYGAHASLRIWESSSGDRIADARLSAVVPWAGCRFLWGDQFLHIFTSGARHFIVPAPPRPQGAVPRWLLRLATVFAGGEIDAQGNFQVQDLPADTFDSLRRELAALPDDAPYVQWGRWLLAEPETRPIAPGFRFNTAGAAELMRRLEAVGNPKPPTQTQAQALLAR